MLSFPIAVLLAVSAPGALDAHASTVTVAWDANAEPDLAGYVLSFGSAPGTYTNTVDVGQRTTWSLTGLPSSGRLYIAVQAYNRFGDRGLHSSEIVADLAGNQPPVVDDPGEQLVTRGAPFSVRVAARDPEGHALRFEAAGLPAGFSMDATTGVLAGQSNTRSWRVASVTVTVRDPAGAPTSVTFLLRSDAKGPTRLVDLNSDGRSDSFMYDDQTGHWTIAFSRSHGFASRSGKWAAGWEVVPARFAGDTLVDLFLYNPASGEWAKAYNFGAGEFHLFEGQAEAGLSVAIGDFAQDGADDVVLYSENDGHWVLFPNARLDSANAPTGQWPAGRKVTVGPLDADNRDDILLYDAEAGEWSNGYSQAGSVPWRFTPTASWGPGLDVYVARLNADAARDLLLYDVESGGWMSGLATGEGQYAYANGTWTPGNSLHFVDLNRDALDDLWAYNGATGELTLCVNQTSRLACQTASWVPGWEMASGDFNADGLGDMLLHHPPSGVWLRALTQPDGRLYYESGVWKHGMHLVGTR